MHIQAQMSQLAPSPAAAPPRDDAFATLERFGVGQMVARGQEFYAAGDAAEFCYRIVTGCVRTVDLDRDGRRQIAEFLFPGDFFGLDSIGAHHLTAEALSETVVIRYPRRILETLARQNPAMALRLRELAVQQLRRAHEKLFLLGRKSASERIATFLLEMAGRAPAGAKGKAIPLPMTRGDMADHLGLTIETVSRTMAQLCRDGVIACAKCGIEILDRQALVQLSTDTRH